MNIELKNQIQRWLKLLAFFFPSMLAGIIAAALLVGEILFNYFYNRFYEAHGYVQRGFPEGWIGVIAGLFVIGVGVILNIKRREFLAATIYGFGTGFSLASYYIVELIGALGC